MREDYAKLLLVSGQPDRALDEARLSLETILRVYGENNPWTTDAARTTLQVLEALGRSEEALTLRDKYAIED
jgi:hypothetical protein